MNIQDRFFEYAAAFEECFVDDDWSRLEQHFTDDAIYDNGDGNPAHGREAVMAKFARELDGMDRLMDNREVDFDSAKVEGGTFSMQWTATYTKGDLPPLVLRGAEFARFEGERIAHLWDEIDPKTLDDLNNWMASHGEALSAS